MKTWWLFCPSVHWTIQAIYKVADGTIQPKKVCIAATEECYLAAAGNGNVASLSLCLKEASSDGQASESDVKERLREWKPGADAYLYKQGLKRLANLLLLPALFLLPFRRGGFDLFAMSRKMRLGLYSCMTV